MLEGEPFYLQFEEFPFDESWRMNDFIVFCVNSMYVNDIYMNKNDNLLKLFRHGVFSNFCM